METLVQACERRGIDRTAALMIIGQYSVDGQLPKHCKQWNTVWLPFCAKKNIDPYVYVDDNDRGEPTTATQLANVMAEVHLRAASNATAKGKDAQHPQLKAIRAAVSGIFQILEPTKPRLTLTDDITALAKSARLTAPNKKKYDCTWDVTVVFEFYENIYNQGYRNETMPLPMLRKKAIVLGRVRTSARSSDLAKVFRLSIDDSTGGTDKPGLWTVQGKIKKWRYYRPKNVATLAGHMSGWVDVGDDFDDLLADEIWGSGNAIQTYFERTDGLPRTTDADGNYPFFLAASKTKGSYKGIGSETIAKDMLNVMDAAGVDVEMFKAHSGRHASLAAKAEAGVKMETFLSSAKMSGAVYQKFYNVPVLKKQRTEKMTAVLSKSRLYSASSETRTAPNVD